jgi:AICAR transformylase/IMP cyclohydrolase PurH
MPTALLSVYEKAGIANFAQALVGLGWSLVASGGTCKALNAAGLPVRDVAELVGGGAILGHRVVTLSREVHAGLLARHTPEDAAELEALGLPRIDLVCVDLYPLTAAMTAPDSTPEKILEQLIRDMNEQLINAKKQVAQAIADERSLQKQAEQEASNAAEWERKAMLAVRHGDDRWAWAPTARAEELRARRRPQ